MEVIILKFRTVPNENDIVITTDFPDEVPADKVKSILQEVLLDLERRINKSPITNPKIADLDFSE